MEDFCCDYPLIEVCDVVDSLPQQYKQSPNITSLISIFVKHMNCITSSLNIICGQVDCSELSGDALTAYGNSIGFPRCHCDVECGNIGEYCVEDDLFYCILIKAHICSKQGSDIETLCKVLKILFGEGVFVISSINGVTKIGTGRKLTNQEKLLVKLYERCIPRTCATRVEIYEVEDLSEFFGVNCGDCQDFLNTCEGASPLCNPITCEEEDDGGSSVPTNNPPSAPDDVIYDDCDSDGIDWIGPAFSDVDGDSLTITPTDLPSGMVFTQVGNSPRIQSPNIPDFGPFVITFTAYDYLGASSSYTLTIDCDATEAPNCFIPNCGDVIDDSLTDGINGGFQTEVIVFSSNSNVCGVGDVLLTPTGVEICGVSATRIVVDQSLNPPRFYFHLADNSSPPSTITIAGVTLFWLSGKVSNSSSPNKRYWVSDGSSSNISSADMQTIINALSGTNEVCVTHEC